MSINRERISTSRIVAIISAMVAGLSGSPMIASADPIRYWGSDVELIINTVSDRTMQIVLAPLDAQGKAKSGAPSTILVEQKLNEVFRTRKLEALAPNVKHSAGKLALQLIQKPLSIKCTGPSGEMVQTLTFDEDDGVVTFEMEAPVLGLGEGAKQFDRRGAYYPMLNGQRSPFLATHGGTIPVPFLIGTDGWALFFHRPWATFDLRGNKGKFIPEKKSKGNEPLELYIVHVEKPADALAEYLRLTGKPVMPPKWAMGYMQSHRTLADVQEPLRIAKTFREKKLPCDALIYLGTGYCPAGWNIGHGTVEFNPKTFDRPAENIQSLHDLNFKVVLHINRAPKNLFGESVTEKSDSPVHISNYWKRHKDLVKLRVDGWWPDDGDELPIETRLARHRCYYEGPLQDRPNLRPWSLHRNGHAGAQRYGGWIWSGDVQSRWATLAAHVPVGINYSLSLTPFWGTDTGGFWPTKELTGELYVRWFQFSAFNPLFRSHGRTWKLRLPWGWNTGEFGPLEGNDGPDKSELHNAAVEPICRKYLELRYQLLPYNYTLMRQACDSGLPPIRALWLHYPDDPEAVKLGTEFLWGRDLLIAPVVEKGAGKRKLYLPQGDWYDWWTGEKSSGKQWIERNVDLATMPIYARAGAIIPLDVVRQYTAQPVTEPTTLRIYAGADGEFVLYDDDGQSLDYLQGKCTWTRFLWNNEQRMLTIEPDERTTFNNQNERVFDIHVLPDNTRRRVTYAGKRLEINVTATEP